MRVTVRPRADGWSQAGDDALRRAAALGDADAFAAVIERHGPAMFRYARRMLNDHGDAEEVVQDAFVAAWKALPEFRGESALRTWLFTLTARKAIDLLRKKRPTPVGDETLSALPAGGSDPVDPAVRTELLEALDAALAELPDRQRAVWLLREIEEMSYHEIAEVLATTPTVVRGQLARARIALQEKLEDWR
ncbi:sigma-70 family RNA polymerase sigma factor [Kribbella sp. NPDC056861]|uniref:RNA polymerase sigma factor n=1 Tax=Kribbella sp. NPDC056861 TaxID=3154857 RepID=UPI003414581F